MKCPLTTIVQEAPANPKPEDWCDCIQAQCAWWNRFTEECAIYMIALEVNAARAALQVIVKKKGV